MKKIMMIEDQNDWEMVKKESAGSRQVVLLKYSPYCGGSHMCRRLFERWFKQIKEDEKITCAGIDVISSRKLSNLIAQELNIKHESPQVIWIDTTGKVKWYNSHYLITEEVLTSLLN